MPAPTLTKRPTINDAPGSHRRIQCERLVTGQWEVVWPGSLPCSLDTPGGCFCECAVVATWPQALTIIRDRVDSLAAQPKETRQ